MTKLSIITINLNNASGLRKTIESVVSQTFSNFEYIIIDGGSTDVSVEVIKEYSDKITDWVSETDKGIYNAMNKGIEKANGEYCLFLNSGDWLIENVLEEVFKFHFSEDIFYGNSVFVFPDRTEQINKGCGKSELTFNDFFNDTIRHQAAFIKRDLFSRFGLYDESYTIVSDWLFFIKTIIFGDATCRYENINISYFDTSGIGTIPSQNHLDERTRVLTSILPQCILKDYKNYQNLVKNYQTDLKILNRYKHRFYLADKFLSIVKKKLISNIKIVTYSIHLFC